MSQPQRSENFAVSFGDFKNGFLWVEGTTGAGPKTQTKANQQTVEGASHNTKDSPLYFAPHLHHCVLPWRFQYAGTLDDIRSQHVDTGVWPLWLAATHGHSNKIAEEIDDNDLAVAWFWDQTREELGGTAAFKGTPILAKGEFPPRLYHRTTHDAAFAILETQLTPDFGRSGKYHHYFAKATLDELGERGGVRANLKFEMVCDTSEVLEHAWLFETASEGILCREEVPGSSALYIRDAAKNVIVWTRPDPEAEEEEEITIDAPLTAAPSAEPEPEFVISEDELVNVEVDRGTRRGR